MTQFRTSLLEMTSHKMTPVQPKTLRSPTGVHFTLCAKYNFTPQRLKPLPQQHPQAVSPKMLTDWTQNEYYYSSLDVNNSIMFPEFVVCLAHDHVILEPNCISLYLHPIFQGNMVENTAHYAILKINEDSCFLCKSFASYSHLLNL